MNIYGDPLLDEGDQGDQGDGGSGLPEGAWEEGGYIYWDEGKYRIFQRPDGKLQTEVWDPYGGPEGQGGYKLSGAAVNPPAAPRGGVSGPAAALANAATTAARERRLAEQQERENQRQDEIDRHNRERQVNQDAIAAEERERKRDEAAYNRAIDQRDYDEAKRIRERQEQREDRIDKLNEEQQEKDNKFRESQAQATKDVARGYVDGMPTLSREQWAAEIANQPGNYFNYAFRSRGEEPPGVPPVSRETSGTAPAGSSTAATRDISQWRNMDIPTILATFSATEL